MAAAHGLARAEALEAVTLYPAQIMGVADKFGSRTDREGAKYPGR